ncbi:hypothetical protein QR680_016276 [Steinernema hermaphroditum]|uniref:Uncharacterized protein n=1 Tax=Steinernema hermaphroditum TaxID=289476 RepID=A0AA39HD59_9BILA|nr:hypothetical protein QR680_016276 [Steinernema hermaphroditum]
MSACGNGTFVFGCELQGKGVTAQEDTIIGTTIWIKGQLGKSNVAMRRNVRFFFQTSIQNFTMMIALTMIVVVNNQPSPNGIYMNVLGFITIIITHINNA